MKSVLFVTAAWMIAVAPLAACGRADTVDRTPAKIEAPTVGPDWTQPPEKFRAAGPTDAAIVYPNPPEALRVARDPETGCEYVINAQGGMAPRTQNSHTVVVHLEQICRR